MPLKLPPVPGPDGASLLCPGAVALSKVAHQSPSCLSSPLPPARHKERIWLGTGREGGEAGPGPLQVLGWGSGTCPPWLWGEASIFLLQAPPSTCQSSAPAHNNYSEWSWWSMEGSIHMGTQQRGIYTNTSVF